VQPGLLLRSDFGALQGALPVIALAFVYQNVVPVIVSSLEGDIGKVRAALVSPRCSAAANGGAQRILYRGTAA
jgi:tyrosine-specific transport protein